MLYSFLRCEANTESLFLSSFHTYHLASQSQMWETFCPLFECTQIIHARNYTGTYACARNIIVMLYGCSSFKSYLLTCVFGSDLYIQR